MNKILFLSLLLAGFFNLEAQKNKLSIFEPLMGKVWKAEGIWGDGTTFKQEIEFRYELDSTLVITDAKGFTDELQTNYGNRNHGIRKYDKKSKSIKFWEFDVFGGVTEGNVVQNGQDFIYTYDYEGTRITDYWEYLNDKMYNFIVGSYENGEWKQKYLETQFKAIE